MKRFLLPLCLFLAGCADQTNLNLMFSDASIPDHLSDGSFAIHGGLGLDPNPRKTAQGVADARCGRPAEMTKYWETENRWHATYRCNEQ